MITTNLPSNFASAVTPYTPVGRQPVGQENPEIRNTPFKPVEESASSAQLLNRRNPDDRSESIEREQSSRRQQNTVDEQQTQAQADEVRDLSARDREVRQHERAHSAVGQELTGAPVYEYETGPDGRRYAVAGEVSLSFSEVEGDPEATLELARLARQAALAPDQPSQQDRRVAALATQLEIEALQELSQQQQQARVEEQMQADNASAQATEEAALTESQMEKRQAEERQQEREQQSREDEQQQALRQQQLQEFNRLSAQLNQRILQVTESSRPTDIGSLLDQLA